MTEGLEQLSNGLFYDNKITNADCTKLAVRPKSQEAIEFIEEEYNVVTLVPHVCLHVPRGATQTTKWMSCYNLHNIVVAVNAVKRILARDLFKQSEIFIIVPYRAQAERYRERLRRLKLSEIEVLTNTTVYLRRFLAYYQTRSVTCTVEPTRLAEFGTLDMTEATGYLKTLQLEANQGRCSNCGQPGHRASSCTETRAPRCSLCRTVGHSKQNCEFRNLPEMQQDRQYCSRL